MRKATGGQPLSEAEIDKFTERWWEQEGSLYFEVGCADYASRKAAIYAIGAAKAMCNGAQGDQAAIKLLNLALEEMERIKRPN